MDAGYTGLAHGLTSYGPEQLYRATQTLGKILGSDSLQQFGTEGIDPEKRIRELDPFYQVDPNWMTDGWGRSLYEGFRGISASAYGMLPGAAISLIPGGQVVGIASMAAGGGSVAGLAEYSAFMDEAYEQLSPLNPSLTRQDIEDSVFQEALWSSIAEGGIEAVSDAFGAKLIGLFGKAGVQPAKHILDQLVRNMTKTMVTEAGGEVATAMIQDYLKESAGLDHVGRVEAFKQTLGPSLVGGAVFGLGGTGLKLAQGQIDSIASVNAGKTLADLDSQVLELQRQFRESHYIPQAVSAFDTAMAANGDYVKASSLMEAVESTAKSWADRTKGNVADWRGDSGKLVDLFTRLEAYKANPEASLSESLNNINQVLFSELSADQKQILADTYKMPLLQRLTEGQGAVDPESFGNDFKQLLNDPKHIDNIPEAARPVMESMRDSMLDLYGLANRTGLTHGIDPELSQAIGKAMEYRDANKPRASAFIVQQGDLDNVFKMYGDFGNLTAEKQSAMIKDMAKATQINFDTWDMPTNQKALLGFIDTDMKPMLDKLMNRGKRQDAVQEGLAKKSLEKDGINLERFAEFTAQLTGNGDIKQSAAVKARELQLAERLLLEKTSELATVANETLAPADIIKWQMAGEMAQQIHAMLRAVRSESGHLLNAWKYIKKDPDLERSRIEQMFEAQGGFEAARLKLAAFDNAKTNAERMAVMSDSLKATTANMFVEYRTLNLLSSLKTHVVNTVGNAGTVGTEIWNRFLAEKMGKGQGVVSGETTALIGGMWEGLINVKNTWRTHKAEQGGTLAGLKNVNNMWENNPVSSIIGDAGLTKRSLTRENALDVIGGVKERIGLSKEHGMISNGMSSMVEYLGRMLNISGEVLLAQDQFFKTIAAHGELHAQNHRLATIQSGGDKAKYNALMEQFKKKSPAENKQAAMDFANLVTFQTPLTGFSKSFDTFRKQHALTKTLIPFFKTPVNIMKYAAAHTPGVANLFSDIRADLNSPDLGKRHLAEARVMTGTFVWASAISLAASGLLTGSGPTDKNEKEKARTAGWQANSLRIPGKDGNKDTYIALDRLDPAAFLLNTAASLVEIYDSLDDGDLSKAMWGGLAAAFRVASDRSYLASISDAVAAVSDWEGYEGNRARQGLATSMIPASSMMRAITQQIDPVQREVEGIFDAIKAGIPGMSESLPERRNFLGEVIESDGYYGSNWLSPLRQSFSKQDPVYDEIYRLTKAGYKIPSMPDKHFKHNGTAYKMNPEQYSAFLELAGVGLKYGGKNAKERIAEVVESSAYKNWDDEKQAKQITAIIESYRREAKKTVVPTHSGWNYLVTGQ